MVSEILFIQRFNLDTELGLYGTRNSSEKKKRSPPQKSNNLIKDSVMSNIFYLLNKIVSYLAPVLSDLFFHKTPRGLTILKACGPPGKYLFEILRRVDVFEGTE